VRIDPLTGYRRALRLGEQPDPDDLERMSLLIESFDRPPNHTALRQHWNPGDDVPRVVAMLVALGFVVYQQGGRRSRLCVLKQPYRASAANINEESA